MKILEIKKDKWTQRYIVCLENNENYKFSIDQIVKYDLKEDSDIDYIKLIEALYAENIKEAYNKALELLTLKDYTSFEIKTKLNKKGYDDDVIENVIYKLIEYNFINDERYANNYLNYSLKHKKHGKNKIIYSLRQKGIDKSILNNLNFDNDKEYEYALILGEKKFNKLTEDKNKKEKIYRYLLSRGYNIGAVLKVIETLFK